MRTRPLLARLCCLLMAMSASLAALADDDSALNENNASPYFFVESADASVDALPLKATRVDARVLGNIAEVRVTQEYRNQGATPLEARYVFPASTRAAVHGMTVRLGERVIQAQIREKQKAQAEYQQAKSAGKTAALLEQERENVFQMQVANILPGDVVQVELRYSELLVPTDGRYQFVFPTVVGPRYNGKGTSGSGNQPWISTPYLQQGQASATQFALQMELLAPVQIGEIASPSHHIDIQRDGQRATLHLAADEAAGNNRDFILDYRLGGDQVQSGLLLSRGAQENFFLAMVTPPRTPDARLIVPRDYVFIVDVSGSMNGFPLDTTKALLRDLIGRLRPSDTFNLLLFSGDNRKLADTSLAATPANIRRATDMLNGEQGAGGTELMPALREALAMPTDPERSRSFVVITDGFVSVESSAYQLVRENLGKANLFAFGIGTSVNRSLIEGLARAGQGEPFIVTDQHSAGEQAERLRRMIDSPLLQGLRASFEGLEVYDVEPQQLPDLFANRPLVLFGKWKGEPRGELRIDAHAADGPFQARLPISATSLGENADALAHLWARKRLASLMDQEALDGGFEFSSQILDLGLKYQLLTPYTSFIAVDQQVRNPDPQAIQSVDQPLPLPQGVNNSAIGSTVPGTPEPGVWAMLLLAGLGAWWWRRKAA
ncbi:MULTISPECIES: VIT domain-containing protein [Pseudomonas]|uniref:VIT domain-containing protein n=1 Tax=Pseudomonas nitroreducens TaxID=46680 RepID=UPI001E4031C1|nr:MULTISPECIES: VIT domain-containing protein [Pseudomonas]MCE4067849.1 VIT and VWA domain-containing protein [Pseudomonas nitritireducens]MCE4077038.1 VIT and VWA domain-containing protein [Pseudomonas nitroreducens]